MCVFSLFHFVRLCVFVCVFSIVGMIRSLQCQCIITKNVHFSITNCIFCITRLHEKDEKEKLMKRTCSWVAIIWIKTYDIQLNALLHIMYISILFLSNPPFKCPEEISFQTSFILNLHPIVVLLQETITFFSFRNHGE